jgi:WD40 repeat protein
MQSTLTFNGHTGEVISVAFSPDGSAALSGAIDRTLKLIRARRSRCAVGQLRRHAQAVGFERFSQAKQEVKACGQCPIIARISLFEL